jgi:hypothetical protein
MIQKFQINFIKLILALSLLMSGFYPLTHALAAEPIVSPANESFRVNIGISTNQESLNAIEGMLVFPPNLLLVESINFSSSIISLWVEQPKVSTTGVIAFSGAIPGGARGGNLNLFSINLAGKAANTKGEIQVLELRGLKYDGLGSIVDLPKQIIPFQITSATPNTKTLQSTTAPDVTPPEHFEINLYFNPDIDQGKWMAVFFSRDKESGIKNYQVWETKDPKKTPEVWVESNGQYILQDQTRNSFLFVRAIDNSGNVQLATFSPAKTGIRGLWVALGAILVAILYITIIKYLRYRKIQTNNDKNTF